MSVTINNLPIGNPLTGSEVLPLVQSNTTIKATVQEIINLAGGGLEGTKYLYVAGKGTPQENGEELKAAYTTAQTMSPTLNSRVTIIVGPGKYFNATPAVFPAADGQFEFTSDFIDVVSLTGEPDVFLSGISVGGICYIKGINTSEALNLGGMQAAFNLINSNQLQKIENCIGGNNSFGWGGNINGTFINCIGGNGSFGSATGSSPSIGITDLGTGNIGGIFINCEAGNNSFGNYLIFNGPNDLTGTFENCKAGSESFGNDSLMIGGANLSGIFTNCSAGSFSFGGSQNGTLSGSFINCKANSYSFGGDTSGIFTNCIAKDYSFSSMGKTASGVYKNCEAGDYSFGNGSGLNATGTFTYCKAGSDSFGSGTGVFTNCISGDRSFGANNLADGIYTNCIAGANSFGISYGPSISGKLYYCRLTSGTFRTVTGGGRTIYCIDGNDTPNNQ